MSSSSSSSSSTATADSTTNGQNDTKTSGSLRVIDFSYTVRYIGLLGRDKGKEGWVRKLLDLLLETAFEDATLSASTVHFERTSPFLEVQEAADAAADSLYADIVLKAEATFVAALEKAGKESDSDRKEGQPALLEVKKNATEAYEKTLEVARNDLKTAQKASEMVYFDAVKPATKTYDDAVAPAVTVRETIKTEEDPVFSDAVNRAWKVFEITQEAEEAACITDLESKKPHRKHLCGKCSPKIAAAEKALDESCKAACYPVVKRFRERFEAALATSVDTSHH